MTPKKILISILIFLSIFVSVVVYFGLSKYSSVVFKPNSSPLPTRDPTQPFSVLLLGYGGENHDGGALTDTIILAKVIPTTKQITLISIPRDLWVQISVGSTPPYYSKINAAFSAGGGPELKKIIADVTGITPDYYISVDFSGFTKAIDLLGGVDVNVENSFIDRLYPLPDKQEDTCGKTDIQIKALSAKLSGFKLEEQFPCRYEVLTFKKGITHMDGTTALKYVRSRHSSTDGGDFNRSARQRQLMLAIKDKVISLNFFTKAVPLFNTLTNHLRTDIDVAQLEKFIIEGVKNSDYSIKSLALTGENVLIDGWSPDKQAILIPKLGIGEYESIKAFLGQQASVIQ